MYTTYMHMGDVTNATDETPTHTHHHSNGESIEEGIWHFYCAGWKAAWTLHAKREPKGG